jgi:hypothetical protein
MGFNRNALWSNALVQLQAQYHHRAQAASEKCLSAATFVRRLTEGNAELANRSDPSSA